MQYNIKGYDTTYNNYKRSSVFFRESDIIDSIVLPLVIKDYHIYELMIEGGINEYKYYGIDGKPLYDNMGHITRSRARVQKYQMYPVLTF